MTRIRVLIMAEAVTLAHAGRPAALAAGLDPQRSGRPRALRRRARAGASTHLVARPRVPRAGAVGARGRTIDAAGRSACLRDARQLRPGLLDEPDFRVRAKEMADRFASHDAPAAFARAVERLSRQ